MLRCAVAQYGPRLNDPSGNREQALTWIRAAADAGAGLVVLPELAATGYAFDSVDEAQRGAEAGAEFVAVVAAAAAARDIDVVAGFAEFEDGTRYNAAVVAGPEGVRAVYRKNHCFYREKDWFEPGNGLVVVERSWGRLGVLICYDMWFPEAARALAHARADVIAVPTNWVGNFKATHHDDRGYCQGNYVAMVTAAQTGCAIACADRIGREGELQYLGASIIVKPDGWPVAGPASVDSEAMLVADIDVETVEAARRRTPRNHILQDTRASYPVSLVRSGART